MKLQACFLISLFWSSMNMVLESSVMILSLLGVLESRYRLVRNSWKSCQMCSYVSLPKITWSYVSDTLRQHRTHSLLLLNISANPQFLSSMCVSMFHINVAGHSTPHSVGHGCPDVSLDIDQPILVNFPILHINMPSKHSSTCNLSNHSSDILNHDQHAW